ncbi:MAG: TrbI/VirB10 family protein [Flavobacteriaceae bacterium]
MSDNKLEDFKKKEKSPVAGTGKNNSNIGIAIIIIAAFALIYFSTSEKKEKAQQQEKFNITSQKDTSFATRRKSNKKEKKEKAISGLTPEQEALIKQAIALDKQRQEQSKQEKQAEIMKIETAKRKSKMLVFSGSTKNNRSSNSNSSIQQSSLSDFLKPGKVKNKQSLYDVPEPSLLDVTQVKQIPVLSRTLTAGKFISGILETAIDSTLPGDIRAVVNNDVYSHDGSNVLIPKGTRLIGNYKAGIKQGQARVYVIWSTAITPDGIQVPLASKGTNSLGVTGLSGDYDAHFFKRFGAALLLSVVENQNNGNNQLSVSTQNSLSNASSIALNQSINIPPTIYVDQGEKINIFVARNILF